MANENEIQATGTFVVSKGLALITKLVAAKGELEFTRGAVGIGSPPEGYSPEALIGLNAYKMDAQIAEYGVQDNMAYVTVQVNCADVPEGFVCTEVGVFANDPDEGEILYGYLDLSTDPVYIYANGSSNRLKFAEFTLFVLIGSVSKVVAAVTPGSIITRETFKASNMPVLDTYNILGDEEDVTTQMLLDAIADRVLTKLVTKTSLAEQLGDYILKSKIVNHFLATDADTVLSGPMGKQLKEEISELNTETQGKQDTLELPSSTSPEYSEASLNGGWIMQDSSYGYYNMKMGWAMLQFRVNVNKVEVRRYWGASEPSEWKQII